MGDAALPAGWTREFSKKQQRPYLYHAATQTSKWNIDDVIPPDQQPQQPLQKPSRDDAAAAAAFVAPEAKRLKQDKQPKLAVIVPYRDDASHSRAAQLDRFAPHMARFLADEAKLDEFKLFIVEQGDKRKFNRGKLLNAGFTLAAHEGFDTFVFHDVDLLPQPPVAKYYAAMAERPIHIAKCWSRYNKNPEYLGGIVTFSKHDFERIGGFPNVYWGWGGEDDELKKRVTGAGLIVEAPPVDLANAIVDLENKTLEEKLAGLRATKAEKCNVKWEVNAAHDALRNAEPKPAWWGLPVSFKLVRKDEDRFAKCVVATVDIGLNFEADGTTAHWTNDKSEYSST